MSRPPPPQVTLTANTYMLAEQPAPYSALLSLSVSATISVDFIVPVILFVEARDD